MKWINNLYISEFQKKKIFSVISQKTPLLFTLFYKFTIKMEYM